MNLEHHPSISEAQRNLEIGNIDAAKAILLSFTHQFPSFSYAYELLGYVLIQKECYEDAVISLTKASNLDDCRPSVYYYLGKCFCELDRTHEALSAFEYAIKLDDRYFEALHDLGLMRAQSGEYEISEGIFLKALNINPGSEETAYNLALVYQELNKVDQAIELFEKVIEIDPSFLDAIIRLASIYRIQQRFESALICYEQALKVDPNNADILNESGLLLQHLGRYDSALIYFKRILEMLPKNEKVLYNIGNLYKVTGNVARAMEFFDRALEINSEFLQALNNKAALEFELKKYSGAVRSYQKILEIDPNFKFAYGALLHSKMHLCEWTDFHENVKIVTDCIGQGKPVIAPLPFLALVDSLKLSKKCAQIWGDEMTLESSALTGIFTPRLPNKKIVIGYYSADWYGHATSYLMAELLELHDRSKFEIIGFSFSGQHSDQMKKRIESAFDSFYELDSKTDLEIVEFSRTLEIDIAVDLKGYTAHSRPCIFSMRAAPIQVAYLGYPGTSSLGGMDYIFADAQVIPPESSQYYSEKVVYLQPSYQPNDRKRKVSERVYTRSELGFPEEGFIFCCFNNSYKIIPDIFSAWMTILEAVPGSVLWLIKENDLSARNLKKEAAFRGVSEERIIFTEKVEVSEHLARHSVADLFLDTFPYNAHTTASDALWCGLPVLTYVGNSFASRVASSLLAAVNLQQLCAHDLNQYVEMAIQFGLNPSKLDSLKNYLQDNRMTLPLFDTQSLASSMEAAYMNMMDRYRLES